VSALLDTHVLVRWFGDRKRLSRPQRRLLDRGTAEEPLLVSDITLWEIATLNERGRLRFSMPLRDWLERATAAPLVRRLGITPAVAAEVAALPASFHRDPADRILVATARVHGAKLLTSDARIIDAEIVETIA
jgi:PIN domain nuclease of toxin-antitoxin system